MDSDEKIRKVSYFSFLIPPPPYRINDLLQQHKLIQEQDNDTLLNQSQQQILVDKLQKDFLKATHLLGKKKVWKP